MTCEDIYSEYYDTYYPLKYYPYQFHTISKEPKMAKCEVIRETPNPPPIKEVVLRLTEKEAKALYALLYGGVASINVSELYRVYADMGNAGIFAEFDSFWKKAGPISPK